MFLFFGGNLVWRELYNSIEALSKADFEVKRAVNGKIVLLEHVFAL